MKIHTIKHLLNLDENTGGASSASSANTEGNSSGTDANAASASSGAQDGTAGDDKPQTLLDAVQSALGDADASAAKGADESGSKNEQDSGEKTDADKEGQNGESETKEEGTETEGEPKGPVPLERFQEVVKERNEFKTKVEQYEAKAQNFDEINGFCEKFSIDREQFRQALKIQALLNTDPESALKELGPIIEQLQGFQGERLPDDLKAAVEAGEVSEKFARELAKTRAQHQFGQKQTQQERERAQQRAEVEGRQRLAVATQQWETSKRNSDPDYKPKAGPNSPDGKWEDVRDKFTALLHQTDAKGEYVNPVRNESEMTALMEKAYQAVNVRNAGRPKAPSKKVLASNGSTNTNTNNVKAIEDAPTLAEAVRFALDGKK